MMLVKQECKCTKDEGSRDKDAHMMCGYTRNYEIKNKVIQDKIGVAVLVHKMREAG